ncbi:hypothetical protein ACOZ4I_14850 [Haloarcula salina]|uniref:hypothetical protein n=1 Tax=Haloarcula salina TaxID=1429914 RepID=UPI003C6F49C1
MSQRVGEMSGPDSRAAPLSDREARQRVLRTDLAVGLGGAVLGYAEAGPALLGVGPVLAVVALLSAAALYAVEHDAVPGVYPEVTALASLVVLASVVAGFVVVIEASATIVLAGALSGFGGGVLCYRLCYGFLLAVPDYRLDRVRER